jgi:hypothetical protein
MDNIIVKTFVGQMFLDKKTSVADLVAFAHG